MVSRCRDEPRTVRYTDQIGVSRRHAVSYTDQIDISRRCTVSRTHHMDANK